MVTEKVIRPMSGWYYLLGILLVLVTMPIVILVGIEYQFFFLVMFGSVTMFLVVFFGLFGFVAVQPNDARVLLLFGKYLGTIRDSGFYWVNPFYSKKKISMRVRNFETGSKVTPAVKNAQGQVMQAVSSTAGRPAKVNDRDGNPIEISAVVVWRVVDSAEAMFEVDDYEDFVRVQSESALRSMASRHPYDCSDESISLRGNTEHISQQLRDDIQDRLNKAGVETIEARISYLAYAPEIAAAMLQRQQAQAVVAARTQIVEGAVGMVEMALEHLSAHGIVELSEQQRASLVANLLVVLCSDRHTQPVVQTGTSA